MQTENLKPCPLAVALEALVRIGEASDYYRGVRCEQIPAGCVLPQPWHIKAGRSALDEHNRTPLPEGGGRDELATAQEGFEITKGLWIDAIRKFNAIRALLGNLYDSGMIAGITPEITASARAEIERVMGAHSVLPDPELAALQSQVERLRGALEGLLAHFDPGCGDSLPEELDAIAKARAALSDEGRETARGLNPPELADAVERVRAAETFWSNKGYDTAAIPIADLRAILTALSLGNYIFDSPRYPG